MISKETEIKNIVPENGTENACPASVQLAGNKNQQVSEDSSVFKDIENSKDCLVTPTTKQDKEESIIIDVDFYGKLDITPDVKIHFPEVEEEVKDIVIKELSSFKGQTFYSTYEDITLKVTEDAIEGKPNQEGNPLLPAYILELDFNGELKNMELIDAINYAKVEVEYVMQGKYFPSKEVYTSKEPQAEKLRLMARAIYSYIDIEKPQIQKTNPFQEEDESDEDFQKRTLKNEKYMQKEYARIMNFNLHKAWEVLEQLISGFVRDYAGTEHANFFFEKIKTHNEKMQAYNSFEGVPLPTGYTSNGRDLTYLKPVKRGESHGFEKVLMGTLCTITDISHNDDGNPCYIIAYVDNGKIKKLVADQQQISSSRGLESLQEFIYMKGNCLSYYIDFFKEMLSNEEQRILKGCEPTIKQGYVTSRTGWKGNDDFVIGDTTIGRSGKHYKFADRQIAKTLRQKGTLRRWAQGFNAIGNQEVVQLRMCNVTTAPTLRPLNQRSFTANHSGFSSRGKTTAGKAVMSAMGNSNIGSDDSMVRNADITEAALEPHLQSYTDLPTMTDENCLAEDDKNGKKKVLGQKNMVYKIAQEQGRDRSKGGICNIPPRHWKTVMMTSGEHITIDETANAGQLVRLNEFDIMMPENLGVQIQYYEDVVEKEGNYGWFMPYYIKTLICLGEEGITRIYNAVFPYFDDETDTIIHRGAKSFAAQATAGIIYNATCDYIHKSMGITIEKIPNPIELVKKFSRNHYENVVVEGEDIRAIKAIFDDIVMYNDSYNGKDSREYRGFYIQGDAEILIVPHIFNMIMSKEGVNLKSLDIRKLLANKGILQKDGKNYATVRKREVQNPKTNEIEIIRERFITLDYKKADELLNGKMDEAEKAQRIKNYLQKASGIDIPEPDEVEKAKYEEFKRTRITFWNKQHPEMQCVNYEVWMDKYWKEAQKASSN